MIRMNVGRACLPSIVSIVAALGCAAPDARPGEAAASSGAGAGPPIQDPSDIVGTTVQWARTFGDMAGGMQRSRDVVYDAKTDSLVTTIDFDTGIEPVGLPPVVGLGIRDVYALRYPANGDVPKWGVRGGDGYEQFRATAAVDIAGNVILAGGFDGTIGFGDGAATVTTAGGFDVFVAKLDPDGKQLWIKSFGDFDKQFASDVAVDDEGNIVVVGFVRGQIDFGFGPVSGGAEPELFVAKLDPGGQGVWAYRPCKALEEEFYYPPVSVAYAGDKKFAVSGTSIGTVSFVPVSFPPQGDADVFLARIGPDGKGIWGNTFGAQGTSQRGHAVAAGPAGEIAIAGRVVGDVSFGGAALESGGGQDAFVALFDAAGNPKYSRRFGGPATQTGTGVAIDPKGNVLLSGAYQGVVQFFGENAFINNELGDQPWDGFVAKLDPLGAIVWAMNLNGPKDQYPSAITVKTDGSAIVTGWFQERLDLSEKDTWPALGNVDTPDGFMLSLAP